MKYVAFFIAVLILYIVTIIYFIAVYIILALWHLELNPPYPRNDDYDYDCEYAPTDWRISDAFLSEIEGIKYL